MIDYWKAIEVLQDKNTCIGTTNCDDEAWKLLNPAINSAISAMKKQVPKKPDNLEHVRDLTGELLFKTGNCPECGFEDIYSHRTQHCPKCGQKLDWSEENE